MLHLLTALRNLTPNKILLFSALWICLDFVILGKFSFVSTGDNAEITLPGLISHGSASFDTGLWHVFSTSGNDRLSQGFFGPFSVFVFKIFPGWLANQILVVLQTSSAILGTYFLGQRIKLAPAACLFAAVLYTITQSDGILVQSVMGYLPLLVLALARTLDAPKKFKKWLLLLVVSYIYSATAYIAMILPFTAIVFFFWFIIVERRYQVSDWTIIFGVTLFILIIRAQDFFALGYAGLISARHLQITTYDSYPVLWNELKSFFSADWSRRIVSLLAFYCVLRTAWTVEQNRRLVILFSSVVITVILIVASKPYLVQIFGLLSAFNLVRTLVFFNFVYALCAGAGLYAVWHDLQIMSMRFSALNVRIGKDLVTVLAVCYLLFLSAEQKYRHLMDWVTQGGYVNNFESPIIKEVSEKLDSGQRFRVTSFQMYPNYPNAYGLETVSGYMGLHIKRFQDYWNRIIAPGLDNYPLAVPSEFFRLAMIPRDHMPEWPFDKVYNLNLLSLANTKYVFSRDRLIAPSLKEVHAPKKPWSSLTKLEKAKTNILDNFFGRRHLYVYENLDVFPRFYMVNKIRFMPSAEKLLNAIADADLSTLRTTAFLESGTVPDVVKSETDLNVGMVTLEKYSSDKIRISLNVTGAGVLVVTNPFSPYWKAWIDGKPVEIFPVNHAFWGVYIPQSAHQITFYYAPPYRIFGSPPLN